MNKKIYSKLRLFIVAVVAAVIAVAVINGNLLLAFMVMLLGILASYFIKKNVQEITEDERTAMVANKASRMALLSFATLITVLGVGLLTLKNTFPEFTQAGFTLTDSACLLLLLYNGFYLYYNKKHG